VEPHPRRPGVIRCVNCREHLPAGSVTDSTPTADHPHTDPGDGRSECDTCGKWVWPAIHSCKGVPVTAAALARATVAHRAAQQPTPEDRRVLDLAFNAVSAALPVDRFVSLTERQAVAEAVLAAIEPEIRDAGYAAGLKAGRALVVIEDEPPEPFLDEHDRAVVECFAEDGESDD
jgi:hypothetical protein